jgi:mono/diheme cytochrome c family protein
LFAGLALQGCGPDAETIAAGSRVYAAHCASCHGAKLEGQPNWQEKLPSGRFPAPPHDGSGHTWAHSDRWLFRVVEIGFTHPYARQGYQSDMPGFKDTLSDSEIRAVLAYIKSHWSEETLEKREQMLSDGRSRSLAPGLILGEHLGRSAGEKAK